MYKPLVLKTELLKSKLHLGHEIIWPSNGFTEKLEDLDSKYGDFSFKEQVFTLHYNSMVGDLEIQTDESNGTADFQELLKQLGEKLQHNL
tara:strand:- start:1389 stop:1658 length:270 start_codon:yes stop_codon:yes gene_type:complete